MCVADGAPDAPLCHLAQMFAGPCRQRPVGRRLCLQCIHGDERVDDECSIAFYAILVFARRRHQQHIRFVFLVTPIADHCALHECARGDHKARHFSFRDHNTSWILRAGDCAQSVSRLDHSSRIASDRTAYPAFAAGQRRVPDEPCNRSCFLIKVAAPPLCTSRTRNHWQCQNSLAFLQQDTRGCGSECLATDC